MRILALSLGLGVFVFDLISKWWVKNTFTLHNYSVVKGLLTIQYVRNEGIAFGWLHSLDSEWKAFALGAIAIVAMVVVVFYLFRTPEDERLLYLALGLLLGGILGNFVDRLFHGYVFDFITLHWKDQFAWPTFNVADAAISTGVFFILFRTFFESEKGAALALIPVAGLTAPAGLDTAEIVNRLQTRYEQIESFEARFEQRFENRGIELAESGILMMKRPGKMYWEYREPGQKFFVADGKRTFFYVPAENQVLISRMDLEDSDSPLLFLLGKGDFNRDFEITEEIGPVVPNNVIRLRLTPRQTHPEVSYLILEISAQDFLIRSLTVVEPIGQQNEYRLNDIRLNVEIPDRRFKLKIPSHVEVIEQ